MLFHDSNNIEPPIKRNGGRGTKKVRLEEEYDAYMIIDSQVNASMPLNICYWICHDNDQILGTSTSFG